MIRIAYSYLKDWGTAQETVQEVFITCYNHYEQYYHADNFRALIYRITINRCKDLLRSALIKKVIVGTDFLHCIKQKTLLLKICSFKVFYFQKILILNIILV